jgi:hypothetical protein
MADGIYLCRGVGFSICRFDQNISNPAGSNPRRGDLCTAKIYGNSTWQN